jgi:hypothetical protein
MIDAVASANRSQRGATIVARAARRAVLGGSASTVAMAPWIGAPGGASGVTVSLRF